MIDTHLAFQPSDQSIFFCLAGWYVIFSLYAFISFARDKRAARRHRSRTPERHLHLLELIGGFPGAWLAIVLLNHKSRKASFIAISFLTSISNVTVVGMLIYIFMFPKST